MAGGSGTRAGSPLPKQLHLLGGMPVIAYSIKKFHEQDPETRIIVVLNPDIVDEYFEAIGDSLAGIRIEYVPGGITRLHSVKNGLDYIASDIEDDALIAVHDAARPLINAHFIAKLWKIAERTDAVIPVVPVTDSLRRLHGDESTQVNRADYCCVQTPQVFSFPLLKEAYASLDLTDAEAIAGLTDDASVVEHFGYRVHLAPGLPENIKITNPMDFAIAKALINARG